MRQFSEGNPVLEIEISTPETLMNEEMDRLTTFQGFDPKDRADRVNDGEYKMTSLLFGILTPDDLIKMLKKSSNGPPSPERIFLQKFIKKFKIDVPIFNRDGEFGLDGKNEAKVILEKNEAKVILDTLANNIAIDKANAEVKKAQLTLLASEESQKQLYDKTQNSELRENVDKSVIEAQGNKSLKISFNPA